MAILVGNTDSSAVVMGWVVVIGRERVQTGVDLALLLALLSVLLRRTLLNGLLRRPLLVTLLRVLLVLRVLMLRVLSVLMGVVSVLLELTAGNPEGLLVVVPRVLSVSATAVYRH
jgi:hypothetical protein